MENSSSLCIKSRWKISPHLFYTQTEELKLWRREMNHKNTIGSPTVGPRVSFAPHTQRSRRKLVFFTNFPCWNWASSRTRAFSCPLDCSTQEKGKSTESSFPAHQTTQQNTSNWTQRQILSSRVFHECFAARRRYNEIDETLRVTIPLSHLLSCTISHWKLREVSSGAPSRPAIVLGTKTENLW